MYTHIMVPVDLTIPLEVKKAAKVAGAVADWQTAPITLMAVTGTGPSGAPHSRKEINTALETARDLFADYTKMPIMMGHIASHDVAAEVDRSLARAAEDISADLVVVGTHAPRLLDYVMGSHAGYLAKHATMSVLVVR